MLLALHSGITSGGLRGLYGARDETELCTRQMPTHSTIQPLWSMLDSSFFSVWSVPWKMELREKDGPSILSLRKVYPGEGTGVGILYD